MIKVYVLFEDLEGIFGISPGLVAYDENAKLILEIVKNHGKEISLAIQEIIRECRPFRAKYRIRTDYKGEPNWIEVAEEWGRKQAPYTHERWLSYYS